MNKEELVKQHYKYVWKVVHETKKRYKFLDEHDMFSEGIAGLLIAADKYSTEYKNNFLTYADPWIRVKINSYCRNNNRIVTNNSTRSSRKVYNGLGKAIKELQEKEIHVDQYSIAKILDVDVEDVNYFFNHDFSLDSLEENNILFEYQNVENKIFEKQCKDMIEKIRPTLSNIETKILDCMLTEQSYTNLSKELNISKQRVGQIKERLLTKIRNTYDITDLF